MSSPTPRLICAVLLLPVLASFLAPSQERRLKDGDLKSLATALGEYSEAQAAKKDVIEAEAEVKEAMDKLQKKLKGGDPLAFPADIGKALWLSKKYDKARVKKGKVESLEFDAPFIGEKGLEYVLWAPSKYSARKNSYPLIISISDEGRDPKQHITEDWIAPEIRDNVIVASPVMPADTSSWGLSGSGGNAGGVAHVLITLKAVTESYAVDFDRIYLAGYGAGVEAAVAIAGQFPDRFAGVIGRSGDAGETSAVNFRNLPTFFAGGGSQATAFQASTKELAYNNTTVEPAADEAAIWAWMESNPRASHPMEVTLVPGSPIPTRAYWLQVPPLDASAKARVDARIERESNTIFIDTSGVEDVQVYLNDILVDLNSPVKVIMNGAEHKDLIPRSFKTTLDLIDRVRSDPSKVYVATKNYHAPPKADAE